jgi:hypothetical protein
VGHGASQALGNGLSFAAALLQGNSSPAAAAQAAAKTQLQQQADALSSRIQQQLAAAGIQLQQPVELTSDGDGGIAVAAGHPQQAVIQQLLSSDYELEHDFNQLAVEYDELSAATGSTSQPAGLTVVVGQSSLST